MLPDKRFLGPPGCTNFPARATDDEFISDMLAKLPWQWRKGVCAKYAKVYEGSGRAAANRWLREGVRDHA